MRHSGMLTILKGTPRSTEQIQEKAEHIQEKDAILLFKKHLLNEQLLAESEVEAIEI